MLATLTDPTKVTLPTNTITRGQIRHQIAILNLTAHTRSVLGRTYAHLLVDPDIIQLNNNLTPLQYNQSKGLIGRPSDKITWAITPCWDTRMSYKRMKKACCNKTKRNLPSPPKQTSITKGSSPPRKSSQGPRLKTETKEKTKCHR